MVEKHALEYICKVGGSRDLLFNSDDLCSKYQTKTMSSQLPGNSSATRIFIYTSGPSDLEGVALTPESQLDVTVSQLFPAELLQGHSCRKDHPAQPPALPAQTLTGWAAGLCKSTVHTHLVLGP